MRYKNRGYLYLFIIISMSQVTPSEKRIMNESGVKVVEWGRYNAAYSEFEKLRDIMIKDIMQMEIPQGTDFYSMLQNKIQNFKSGETLKRIARSVVTGQALDEISHKYIEENVVKGSQNNEQLTHQPRKEEQTQSIENMIEESNKNVIMGKVQKDVNIQNSVQEFHKQNDEKQKSTTVVEKPSEPQTEQEAVKEKSPEPQEATKEEEKSPEPKESTKEEEKAPEPKEATKEEEKSPEPKEATKEEKLSEVGIKEQQNKKLSLDENTKQFEEAYIQMLNKYKEYFKAKNGKQLPNKAKEKRDFRLKFVSLLKKGINQQDFKLQTFLP